MPTVLNSENKERVTTLEGKRYTGILLIKKQDSVQGIKKWGVLWTGKSRWSSNYL
jgi:hypothetical protein